jgi:nucleoside-diphosphate-sugar epimerase
MNQKVLLTGVTGFLGSRLAISLIGNGCEVIALKRKYSSLDRIESILSKIHLFDIEDIDYSMIFKLHDKIDIVIHTATCYGRNNETPMEIFETNTGFPLKLLDAANIANVAKFINTDTKLDKYLNLYSLSKNHLLEWGRFYSMKRKIEFINMRLEHFYGPNDDDSKFTSYVINNCLLNSSSLELTMGQQKRDFIFIDDVVSAYLTVINRRNQIGDNWFSEFEVGSGKPITIRKFVEMVYRMTGSKIVLEFGAIPYRVDEVMYSRANIKALTDLGWKCKFNLTQGLKLTII